MKYKLIQRGNPSNPAAPKKWYASPQTQGTVSLDALATEISGRSSLTRGDVKSVLENLVDLMPQKLADGWSIKLGGLGTFRASFSSSGSDTPEEFNAAQIRGTKVLFTSGKAIKTGLEDISFEREAGDNTQPARR